MPAGGRREGAGRKSLFADKAETKLYAEASDLAAWQLLGRHEGGMQAWIRRTLNAETPEAYRDAATVSVEPCDVADLPPDLLEEHTSEPGQASRWSTDGGESGTLLWYSDADRGGVCSNANAEWTDASSAEDAVQRFLTDRIIT